MLGRRTGTFFGCGAESSGGLEPQRASPPSPPTGTVGPHELIDRDWTQRGGAGEGGRDRAGADFTLFPPLEKHFTFVDTASLESRRPRLAARRDPRLVVFEKSRDFATLYILVLFKLLLFFCFVLFYFEGRNKLDMFSCASTHTHTHTHIHTHTHTYHTHTLPNTNFPGPCTHL